MLQNEYASSGSLDLERLKRDAQEHPEDAELQLKFFSKYPWVFRDNFQELRVEVDLNIAKKNWDNIYESAITRYPKLANIGELKNIGHKITSYLSARSELWHYIYSLSIAPKLFPEIGGVDPKDLDPIHITDQVDTERSMLKEVEMNKNWTLTADRNEDPVTLATDLIRIKTELTQRLVYEEALTKLRPENDKAHYFWSEILRAGYDELNNISEVSYAGTRNADLRADLPIEFGESNISLPIFIKRYIPGFVSDTRMNQLEREIAFMKLWMSKDFRGFLDHSALQAHKKDGDGHDSIWMLDLDRLGFVELDELLISSNLHTQKGREFFLRSCLTACEWLNDISHFSEPRDHFPKSGFLINPILPNPLNQFRTYDYGSFDSLNPSRKKSTSVYNDWFSVDYNTSAINNWSPLIPLRIPGAVEDIPLRSAGFYAEAARLMQIEPSKLTYSMLVDLFRDTLDNLSGKNLEDFNITHQLGSPIKPFGFVAGTLDSLPLSELKHFSYKETLAKQVDPLAYRKMMRIMINSLLKDRHYLALPEVALYGISATQAIQLFDKISPIDLDNLIKRTIKRKSS